MFRSHSSCTRALDTSSEHTAVIGDSSVCITSLNTTRNNMWTLKTVILGLQTLYREMYLAVFVLNKKFKSKIIWCARVAYRYARVCTFTCRLEIDSHLPLRLSPLHFERGKNISPTRQPDNGYTCWPISSEDLPVSVSPVLELQKCAASRAYFCI